MMVMAPIQQVIKNFFATIPDYPFQAGTSLSVSGIDYSMMRREETMRRLKEIETIMLNP